MKTERKGESTQGKFVLVGENRSRLAQKKGWSWEECQKTGVPRNSAVRLWRALSNINIDPNEQIFFNLWNDRGEIIPLVPVILKTMSENGITIVGMGKKVQEELKRSDIPHKKMIHPAARGENLRPGFYNRHVKEVLEAS